MNYEKEPIRLAYLQGVPEESQKAFTDQLRQEYKGAMEMLTDGGNLKPDPTDTKWNGGWGTVEHCVGELLVLSGSLKYNRK